MEGDTRKANWQWRAPVPLCTNCIQGLCSRFKVCYTEVRAGHTAVCFRRPACTTNVPACTQPSRCIITWVSFSWAQDTVRPAEGYARLSCRDTSPR